MVGQNYRNRVEPDGTAGQPPVGFWSRPLHVHAGSKDAEINYQSALQLLSQGKQMD